MKDDVEQLLGQLTPCGVRPELRSQVLAAVDRELAVEPKRFDAPWASRIGWAVAASILIGIGLNVWVNRESEQRMAQLYGPPPISKQAMELASAVEDIGGVELKQWLYRQLTPRRSPGDPSAAAAKYRAAMMRLVNDLQTVSKDYYNETPQKGPEVDRDRSGRTRGDRSGCQCPVRVDHRYTA